MNVVKRDVSIALLQNQVDLLCRIAEEAYPFSSFLDVDEKVEAAVVFLLRKEIYFDDEV